VPDAASHRRAVLLALLVTFLWATSWVLIKVGLRTIPALSFAGLRYALAALALVPLALRPAHRAAFRGLTAADWGRLVVLGVVFYAVTQGAQFVALEYLPAATLSLMLSFSALLVTVLGSAWLGESPSAWQWAGLGVFLGGALVYLLPLPAGQEAYGLLVGLVALGANAASALLGRQVNRSGVLQPLPVTAITMAIGAALLLAAGTATGGYPPLSLAEWAVIAWLALVNTALAFTLWNRTLRTLTAMESALINNTMLIQIPVLAWIFLDEALTPRAIVGLLIAAIGIALVQARSQATGLQHSQD
jgi:drug/metabolite transporter (DMT)-like permease